MTSPRRRQSLATRASVALTATVIAVVLVLGFVGFAILPAQETYAALAQVLGVIEGRVSNGTPNGSSVGGVTVQLMSLLPSGEALPVASAAADSNGAFRLERINTDSSLSYQVRVAFAAGEFRSRILSFAPNIAQLNADIQVFDTTADPAATKFTSVVTIIERSDQKLVIGQSIGVTNASDRAYIGTAPNEGAPRRSLAIPLPPGVDSVQYLDGLTPEEATLEAAGIFFLVPLLPGPREILLRYSIPITADRYLFTWQPEYAVDQFDILLRGLPAEAGAGLQKDESAVNFQGQDFRRLTARHVAPGARLEAIVQGLPFFDTARAMRWAALAIGAVFGVVLVGLALSSSRRPARTATMSVQRERLLEDVADLDESFDAGKVTANVYRDQRWRKLSRLLDLWSPGAEGAKHRKRKL